ncbi:MAG: DUF4058 family protein [Anaerolineae bacterium]|nr:DUF4058 family protein [Anaerolineae bacterium]
MRYLFPGMDPYLEGYLWPDVHLALAAQIRRQLEPFLRPKYVARLAIRMVGDAAEGIEIAPTNGDRPGSGSQPDIEVVKRMPPARATVPSAPFAQSSLPISPPTAVLTLPEPIQRRLVTVEVRDAASNELVTAIELISPTNKRMPDLHRYRSKRRALLTAGKNLLEIDLIRRGTRPFAFSGMPAATYAVALTRSDNPNRVEFWALNLPDPLPVLPTPLLPPDPDVALDLGSALRTVYEEADYDLSLDYTQAPPPPALREADASWLATLLSGSGLR